jgi:hypothetical protein
VKFEMKNGLTFTPLIQVYPQIVGTVSAQLGVSDEAVLLQSLSFGHLTAINATKRLIQYEQS